MIVGTPKEIKNNEFRVGLTPESVFELTAHSHEVLVETGAGNGIGADDAAYVAAGARIVETAAEVFATAEMIVKVKEPQPGERAMLRQDQILYTYLHLAPDAEQTKDLVASGATCIAYETVTDAHGGLPLLKPMSQVAGRMSIQAGATALEKSHGGRGVLLGGVPGVHPGRVVAFGVFNEDIGTEKVVILAETDETDPGGRKGIVRAVVQDVRDALDCGVHHVGLLPHMALLKSTSVKISRPANHARYMAVLEINNQEGTMTAEDGP